MTPKKSKDGLRKDGTSRRPRSGNGRASGTPRIMILALLLVVVAAALLFWPKGGGHPDGIGENRTVVTAPPTPDSTGTTDSGLGDNRPRSSEVDITQEEVKVVAETPEGSSSPAQKAAPAPAPAPAPSRKPARKPARQDNTPSAPKVLPGPEGRWAVQVGGFGQAENADQEAARLQKEGWNAIVMAGSNNQGRMVYRVWIGYFPSRDEAQLFLDQNREPLPDAFVVHR